MDDRISSEILLPENDVSLILSLSNSCVLDEAHERLIEIAKSANGRSELASKKVVPAVVQLCKSLLYPSSRRLILLSLKLLRNLCAGEISNQNSFLEENGVGIALDVVSKARVASGSGSSPDREVIRMGLQLLGNFALAGKEHQLAVWQQFFPGEYYEIAKIRSREICDPLCMVLYTCCNGCDGLQEDLCSSEGMAVVVEIIKTASKEGFNEDWLQLLVPRICLQGSYFQIIFTELYPDNAIKKCDQVVPKVDSFAAEQAFLLSILPEVLNEQMKDITISADFSVSAMHILMCALETVDLSSRAKSCLPTGDAAVDVLGYSLTILRDICACDTLTGFHEKSSVDVVDILVSNGLISWLIDLLRDLEPPALIRKAMSQGGPRGGTTSLLPKCCPYKGFRRDIISIIGNCAYKRKRVQDEIREKNGILLLLQQCVTDEDNPFLREWGIWSVRNLLEDNPENQRVVADLELQGSVDVPEMAEIGLRVEVDSTTRRAKLVNAS